MHIVGLNIWQLFTKVQCDNFAHANYNLLLSKPGLEPETSSVLD